MIFMRKSKTDVYNESSVCSMTVGGRAFDVRGFLEEYFGRLGLERGCSKNVGKGGKGVPVTYPIMYKELDEMKVRVGLQGNLTWHSRRIGRVSRGTSGSEEDLH